MKMLLNAIFILFAIWSIGIPVAISIVPTDGSVSYAEMILIGLLWPIFLAKKLPGVLLSAWRKM